MLLTLTETAAKRVKEMMEDQGEQLSLRIGVTGGGCSGLSYGMGFDDEAQEGDIKMEQHGVNILVDEDSSKVLEGTVIDFQETPMGGGFTIDNPNAISTCGCGSSFRTKDSGEGTPCDC